MVTLQPPWLPLCVVVSLRYWLGYVNYNLGSYQYLTHHFIHFHTLQLLHKCHIMTVARTSSSCSLRSHLFVLLVVNACLHSRVQHDYQLHVLFNPFEFQINSEGVKLINSQSNLQ